MDARWDEFRQLRTDVQVLAGQIKTIDVSLGGDFTELEEFIVTVRAPGEEAGIARRRLDEHAGVAWQVGLAVEGPPGLPG